MLGRGTMVGLTVAACVALFVGVWSNAWWTASASGPLGSAELNVGLRAIEMCADGTCMELSFGDRVARGGGLFRALCNITFYLGLISSIGLAIAVVLRETQGVEQWAPKMGWACGSLFPLSMFTVMMFPGGSVDFSMGYAFYLTLVGSLLGLAAGMLGVGGRGWEGNKFVPMSELTARGAAPVAPVEALPSVMPQPASEPRGGAVQPRTAHAYEQQIREATSLPVPTGTRKQQLRKLPGSSSAPDAAVDSTRRSLRFVARSIELSGAGMSVIFESGATTDVLWSEVTRVIARQLPPDPPFSKTLLLDLAIGSRVVRLLPSTQANYAALPGGLAPSSRDNLRALANLIEQQHPGVIEPESMPFCAEGRNPPQFLAIKQFAGYDSGYSA